MRTSKAQRLFLWMGIVGAFAMIVSALTFFHVATDTMEVYTAEALGARLEAVPLHTMDTVVLTVTMSIPLLLAGFGAWMTELRVLSRSDRAILWGGAIAWVLSVAAFVAALRMASAGASKMGESVVWPADLLQTLAWLAWIPGGLTVALWGGIGVWILSGRAPVPSDWARWSPAGWMLWFFAVAFVAKAFAWSYAPALFAVAPWGALAMSAGLLLAHRWRTPLAE